MFISRCSSCPCYLQCIVVHTPARIMCLICRTIVFYKCDLNSIYILWAIFAGEYAELAQLLRSEARYRQRSLPEEAYLMGCLPQVWWWVQLETPLWDQQLAVLPWLLVVSWSLAGHWWVDCDNGELEVCVGIGKRVLLHCCYQILQFE